MITKDEFMQVAREEGLDMRYAEVFWETRYKHPRWETDVDGEKIRWALRIMIDQLPFLKEPS